MKCEIKYEIDLYAIINFALFITSPRFSLLHFWYISYGRAVSKVPPGSDSRPSICETTDYAIVSQVTDRTQSQLYRPESGLYVIESISFVTVSEKGPVPTSIFRARSIILKYAGRDEERSNRHGWKDYRSDRACVHILWKSKWSRISRYSAVRILGIISIKHRRR